MDMSQVVDAGDAPRLDVDDVIDFINQNKELVEDAIASGRLSLQGLSDFIGQKYDVPNIEDGEIQQEKQTIDLEQNDGPVIGD
jgi:hypothetical protein